jgi:hypothetical protein
MPQIRHNAFRKPDPRAANDLYCFSLNQEGKHKVLRHSPQHDRPLKLQAVSS